MTIAIHLSGAFSLLTATDTQETYTSGEKVDSGKIVSYGRTNPLGSISIAGAGDSEYVTAASQEIARRFQKFSGTVDELEAELRNTVRAFFTDHVLPFVGKCDDENVPDYALLMAVTHDGQDRLWNVERTMMTDATLYDCIGAGRPAAASLLSRLYPLYPTLDSLAILAAYVIYRVKATVDGCGLKTEIRFMQRDKVGIGIVPPETIDAWEGLFRKYDRAERDLFYHAMNFIVRPMPPPSLLKEAMEEGGHRYDHEQAFRPQMKPLQEVFKEIERIQAEFLKFPLLKSPAEG